MLRTYTRKPQECRYIEGVMELCRLCLGTAETSVKIFTDDPGNICSSLALRIMICVGLEVKRDDNLPNLICDNCFQELERYYAFRKRCEVSYQKLKSHLQATRSRQAIDTITEENEEILKEIGINQDENMNINDLGLIMDSVEAETDSQLPESGPVISDVHSMAPVISDVQQEPQTQTFDLSTLITSILVKLGVVSSNHGFLAVLRPDVTRVQLECNSGWVTMRLREEDDDDESQTTKELVERPVPIIREPEPMPKTTFIEPKKKNKTHSNAGCVRCASCPAVLASRSALRRHERVHSGERPYQCPRCLRRFAQKEVMLRHRLVHDEVRPHKCSTCEKSFTQRNALHLHERSHLPPHERALALHSCPHCPKLFLYASGLSRHMMTHSGRVYVCGTCRRQFADKSSVLRHHRAKHAHVAEPDLGDDTEPGEQ